MRTEPAIQEQLENWIRDSGLFGQGDHVRAELVITWGDQDLNPRYRCNYDYRRVSLTENDWKTIMASLTPIQRRGIRIIKKNGNRPTDVNEIWRICRGWSPGTTNNYLKRAGIEFRVKRPESSNWTHYKVLAAKVKDRKKVMGAQPIRVSADVTV